MTQPDSEGRRRKFEERLSKAQREQADLTKKLAEVSQRVNNLEAALIDWDRQ